MDQLTGLERALLEQFRRLATEFDQSARASENFLTKVSDWSRSISERQSAIEARLSQIEATQQRLSTGLEGLDAALDKQTASTMHLVQQVNAFLSNAGARAGARARSWVGSRAAALPPANP